MEALVLAMLERLSEAGIYPMASNSSFCLYGDPKQYGSSYLGVLRFKSDRCILQPSYVFGIDHTRYAYADLNFPDSLIESILVILRQSNATGGWPGTNPKEAASASVIETDPERPD